MKREIKFRAWNGVLNKMIYDLDVGNSTADKDGYAYESDIMQFTGLKDKNGKEIYEGDLFYYTGEDDLVRLCIIVWDNQKIGFEVNQYSTQDPLFAYVDGWDTYEMDKCLSKIEIIGNVYEMKNLLEETYA